MRRTLSHLPRSWAAAVLTAVVAGSLMAVPAGAASPGGGRSLAHRKVCAAVPPGSASCHAQVVVDSSGAPVATAAPTAGLVPADLQAAYGLTATTAGTGQTVAIVDAYDDPNAEADLATYRRTFGLAPCTTANGCFQKVDQNGGTRYPRANASWAQEISLDLDMVSAACPNCKILLVEASSATVANLGAAVNTAAILGATAISNSYGGAEFSQEKNYESYYHHPGVAVTVSSGDAGYGAEYPAASQYVTAVGGTSLTRNASTSRGFTETAWSGAGSGCSAYIPKPTFQIDAGCAHRSIADVAAVADPNTGVAVYDSYAYAGRKGWMVFGGTSVAAPLVASVYALAANHADINDASWPYTHSTALFDVVSGSNGTCAVAVAYLCKAGQGYDGPTGLGAPNGVGAF
jgi:subtilase family serine protease